MIDKRTVFVLGAGASCPYGFPDARGLRDQILDHFQGWYTGYLRGSPDYVDQKMMEGYPSLDDAKQFLDYFARSNTTSVDLFLSRWPRFATVGKMAICLAILHAEKGSLFGDDVKKREHDWCFYLYNRLTQEAIGEEGFHRYGENKVSFVTFNYDRSLEHFLFDSLLHSFEGIDERAATDQLSKTPIVHVYGRPYRLPWEQDVWREELPYGKEIGVSRPCNLLKVTRDIYVVHGTRDNPEVEKVRTEISAADRIFFLGFAYARENLEALGLPDMLQPTQRIYGTALYRKGREIRDVKKYLKLGLERADPHPYNKAGQVTIEDCDCVHLLREFL